MGKVELRDEEGRTLFSEEVEFAGDPKELVERAVETGKAQVVAKGRITLPISERELEVELVAVPGGGIRIGSLYNPSTGKEVALEEVWKEIEEKLSR